MKYGIASSKLLDLENKTVRLVAKASELGTVTATTITIPLADLAYDDLVAADVLIARNITDGTTAVASIVSTNLVLTDTAIAATDVFDLAFRIK